MVKIFKDTTFLASDTVTHALPLREHPKSALSSLESPYMLHILQFVWNTVFSRHRQRKVQKISPSIGQYIRAEADRFLRCPQDHPGVLFIPQQEDGAQLCPRDVVGYPKADHPQQTPGIKDLAPGRVEKRADAQQVKPKEGQELLVQLTSSPEGLQRLGFVHSPQVEKQTGHHRDRRREQEQQIGDGRAFQHPEIGLPIVALLLLPPASPGEKIPQLDRQKHGDIHRPQNQGIAQDLGYIVLPPHGQADGNVDEIGDQQKTKDHRKDLGRCGMPAPPCCRRFQNIAPANLLRPASAEYQPHSLAGLGGANLQLRCNQDALHAQLDTLAIGAVQAQIIVHRYAAALHHALYGSAKSIQLFEVMYHQTKPRSVHMTTTTNLDLPFCFFHSTTIPRAWK
ncbi:hypothetical protein CLOSYM_04315 [[Clostridium] symbiosum ATCC 14940]|uniref:Uncharacterized protein n=1 Tax=[Clostridium] symbiosum ATCC 14940 TaxID=411472 RepID=A0ABC9TRU6_CLOSY|nr:hypothetical protein CLOSYM_04315 [[Clostridium] symbiosum ATCC 14940]